MRPQNFIIKYLDEIPLMQLATSRENQPWVVNVYFAMDNQHSIYWLSQNTRRHSQDIIANPKVAGTVHMPYEVGVPGRAVQFQGEALAVPRAEIETQFQAYAEKFNKHSMLEKLLDEFSPHTLYKLLPELFVLYDEHNFPDEPRQEWRP